VTVRDIKAAIDSLSAAERGDLDRLLRSIDGVASAKQIKLPDQAARRRRILGSKVLPNMVLQERESEPA